MEIKHIANTVRDWGDFRCVACGTDELNYPMTKWPSMPPNCRKCGKPMELYAMTASREKPSN